jgi:hypothetical protein
LLSTRKTSGKADSGEAVQCGAKTKTAREPASLTSQGVSRMASRPPENAALITRIRREFQCFRSKRPEKPAFVSKIFAAVADF